LGISVSGSALGFALETGKDFWSNFGRLESDPFVSDVVLIPACAEVRFLFEFSEK